MATTTPVYGLRKPATTDLVNVTIDLSDNWDKVDLLTAPLASPIFTGVVTLAGLTCSPAATGTKLAFFNAPSGQSVDIFDVQLNGTSKLKVTSGGGVVINSLNTSNLTDANNLVFGTTTGNKLGTATSQKIGIWNATPVVQPAGTTDVLASLVTIGLRAASSNPPLDLGTGAFTGGSIIFGTNNVSISTWAGGATTGIVHQPTTNNKDWVDIWTPKGTSPSTQTGTVLWCGSDFIADATNWEALQLITYRGGADYTLSPAKGGTGVARGLMIGLTTASKIAFHGSAAVAQRAGAAQAAVAVTAATNVTPYGYAQAQADAIVTLINEIRATLVEKGIMKGAA